MSDQAFRRQIRLQTMLPAERLAVSGNPPEEELSEVRLWPVSEKKPKYLELDSE